MATAAFWSQKTLAAIAFAQEQERSEKAFVAWQEQQATIARNGGALNDQEAAVLRQRAEADRRRRLEDAPPPAPGEVSAKLRTDVESMLEPGRKILAMRRMEEKEVDLPPLLETLFKDELNLGAVSLTSDLADEFERAAENGTPPPLPLIVLPPLDTCCVVIRPMLEHAERNYMSPAQRAQCKAIGLPTELVDQELPRVIHLSTLDSTVLDALILADVDADADAAPPAKRKLENHGVLLTPIRLWRRGKPERARKLARQLGLDDASVQRLEQHVQETTQAPNEKFHTLELNLFHFPRDRIANTNGVARVCRGSRVVGALRVALPMVPQQFRGVAGKMAMAQQVFFAIKRMIGATGETHTLPALIAPPQRPFPYSKNAPLEQQPRASPTSARLTPEAALVAMQDPQLVLEYWINSGEGDEPDSVLTIYVAWTTREQAEQHRQQLTDFVGNRTQ